MACLATFGCNAWLDLSSHYAIAHVRNLSGPYIVRFATAQQRGQVDYDCALCLGAASLVSAYVFRTCAWFRDNLAHSDCGAGRGLCLALYGLFAALVQKLRLGRCCLASTSHPKPVIQPHPPPKTCEAPLSPAIRGQGHGCIPLTRASSFPVDRLRHHLRAGGAQRHFRHVRARDCIRPTPAARGDGAQGQQGRCARYAAGGGSGAVPLDRADRDYADWHYRGCLFRR